MEDLPSRIEIENNIIDFEHTPTTVSILTESSRAFLNPPSGFNSGIFLASGYGTAFLFDNTYWYIFDSHARNSEGMIPENESGTSV